MENGSLATLIKRYGKFPENLVAKYIEQVLRGLSYLHDQGVIHCDIKGGNLLVASNGAIKLADFGVATRLTDVVNVEPEDKQRYFVGTSYWSTILPPLCQDFLLNSILI